MDAQRVSIKNYFGFARSSFRALGVRRTKKVEKLLFSAFELHTSIFVITEHSTLLYKHRFSVL